VGELGWELYVPNEFAVAVYELLMEAGQAFNVVNAGYYAINALRLEKGYRAWGTDLTPDYNPLEAGLLFTCKLGTTHDFIGRAALEEAKLQGPRRTLVGFQVSDPNLMLWGGELLLRDGVPSGQVTSAAWSATLGTGVGLGYLWTNDGQRVTKEFLDNGAYQINAGGTVSDITISRRALFDPENSKIHR